MRDEHGHGTAVRLIAPGERAHAEAPGNWRSNATLLASMARGGDGLCVAVEEATTTAAVFEAYVTRAPAPAAAPGRAVVMDNLSARKGPRVREWIEGRGCGLLYLPPYPPDLSPIGQAFSKLKASLWTAQARTFGALWWTRWGGLWTGSAPRAPRSCFFRHCGYRASAQLL